MDSFYIHSGLQQDCKRNLSWRFIVVYIQHSADRAIIDWQINLLKPCA